MPKFSAYMRGEKGIQGETGQASLLDGIVNGYDNLPDRAGLAEDRNYVYYVKEDDGIHLYVYKGGSGDNWQHLGVATAGFSTTQYASASTKEWFPGVQPDVTIIPHEAQQTTGLKSFDFHFNIPESQPAGFSTNQPTSVSTLNWNENATVEITPDKNSPDWDKSFLFKFGIPHGREAGFSTTQRASVSTLSWTSNATVSVSTTEDSDENPFYNKVFDFAFGIPQGEPAGFGTLSTEIEILNHLSTATFNITEGGTNREKDLKFNLGIPAAHPAGFSTVTANAYDLEWNENPEASITTNGNDWEKNFDFSFGIPHGRPAGFSTEMGVSVTTLPSTNVKNKNGNIVQIEKTENNEAKIKNIKINIEPVQDLHGYDAPWPAGGNINLFPPFTNDSKNGVTLTQDADGTVTLNGTASEDTFFDVNTSLSYSAGTPYYFYGFNPVASDSNKVSLFASGNNTTPQVNLNSANAFFTRSSAQVTADNTISKFRVRVPQGIQLTNFKFKPMFQLGGTQQTAWTPYSNVCPITGWTEAKVTRTGRNLIDIPDVSGTLSKRALTSIIPAGQYTFSIKTSVAAGLTLQLYSAEDSSVKLVDATILNSVTHNFTFTTTSPVGYIYVYNGGGSGVTMSEFMLELGSTATSYVPYSGTQVTIDLDGTRYGGELDVLTGEMTVTHKLWDKATLTDVYHVSGYEYRANYNVFNDAVVASKIPVYCSMFDGQTTYSTSVIGRITIGQGKHLYFTSDGKTEAELLTLLQSSAFQLVYPLAEPFNVTLTPAQLSLLESENNIWADTGNINIDYSVINDAYVNVVPDETTPDYAKKFNFDFGIPNGVPGGFGNISVSTQQVGSAIPAEVTITTSGPESAKNFEFLFKIPQGKGSGDAVAGIYIPRSFLSTNIDSTSTIYWSNNILYVKNSGNRTIPICIVNNQNQNVASTFEIDKQNENILYYSDSPFDGTIYLIDEAPIPEFFVHSVSTVSPSTTASVNISYLEEDNSQVFLDFYLPKGDKGDTALSIDKINVFSLEDKDDEPYAEVTTDVNQKIEMTFYLPRGLDGADGAPGPKGDSALTIDSVNVHSISNEAEPYAITHVSESSAIIDFYLPKGDKGDQGDIGNGISSITNLGTIGLTTTYQINYTSTNITPTTFEVINGNKGDQGEPGKGITSINNLGTIGLTTTYQVNYGEGLSTTFEVINGEKGEKGDTALTISNISITTLAEGETNPHADVTTDINHDVSIKFYLPKGATGTGISSITKGQSEGLIDNYIINYDNGTTTGYQVTNGKGIQSITKGLSEGLIDNYKVEYGDGLSTTFQITNGNGIQSINLTNVNELEKTYTITYTNNSTTTFIVKDGLTGDKGDPGQGIQSIIKESTSGVIDNYKINYGDGLSTTFQVTNGTSIRSINLTNSNGLIDTYTITLTDNSTTTYTITNGAQGPQGPQGNKGNKGDKGDKGDPGQGIQSITKESTSGIVDNYKINYGDGLSTTFQVTNGVNGTKGNTGNGISSIEYINSEGLQDNYRINFTNNTSFDFAITNGAVVGDIRSIIYTTTDPGSNISLTTGNIILVYNEE